MYQCTLLRVPHVLAHLILNILDIVQIEVRGGAVTWPRSSVWRARIQSLAILSQNPQSSILNFKTDILGMYGSI